MNPTAAQIVRTASFRTQWATLFVFWLAGIPAAVVPIRFAVKTVRRVRDLVAAPHRAVGDECGIVGRVFAGCAHGDAVVVRPLVFFL